MLPPLFSGLLRVPAQRTATRSLAETLGSVPEAEREEHVLEVVRTQVAATLGHNSTEAVDPQQAFTDLGFDSLAAVELRNRLVAATGIPLQPTAVFDYPSSESLAEHLFAQVDVGRSGGAGEEKEIRGALARLEELIEGIDRDDLLRKSTQARLRSFMTTLSDSAQADDAEGSEEDLESMSNDEIFKLIDEEFGGKT
jgi:acyl carrier protein